jgi:hypothetical protein
MNTGGDDHGSGGEQAVDQVQVRDPEQGVDVVECRGQVVGSNGR